MSKAKKKVSPKKQRATTPRKVRLLLETGKMKVSPVAPKPPLEWAEWKRASLSRCIKAASLFLRGEEYSFIRHQIGMSDLSRQRVSQIVKRGVDFMLSEKFIARRKR